MLENTILAQGEETFKDILTQGEANQHCFPWEERAVQEPGECLEIIHQLEHFFMEIRTDYVGSTCSRLLIMISTREKSRLSLCCLCFGKDFVSRWTMPGTMPVCGMHNTATYLRLCLMQTMQIIWIVVSPNPIGINSNQSRVQSLAN